MSLLIDTHSHIYLEDFSADRQEVIDRAKNNNISKIFIPAISSKEFHLMTNLQKEYPDFIYLMAGLHPSSVKHDFREELKFAEQVISQHPVVAIGEIGLDFYWDITFKDFQYEAFRLQLQLALDNNLPVVIHTRSAMQETIDVVKPFAEKGLTGIFHCFGGNLTNANHIIEMGFCLGIGGIITYKNSGLANVIQQINLAHIVLETDAPYLAPVPFRGKRNESAYLKIIAEKVAAIQSISLEEVAATTTENAKRIFKTKK